MSSETRTTVRRETRTTITLQQKEYEAILRAGVGAPDDAIVDIENNYGGEITVTWSVVEMEDKTE